MSTYPTEYPTENRPHTGETIIFLHGGSAGGWTWQGVVEHLPDRHILTPDLPGFGERYKTQWPGLDAVADEIAELIRSRAVGGQAHVVGLSLGGVVAIRLITRHPEVVRSCLITGAPVAGYSRVEKFVISLQVPLWHRRWYWALQVPLFRIPQDAQELFITTASRPSPDTNRAMFHDVVDKTLTESTISYSGPVLAVTAEHETSSISKAFPLLREALPQLQTWTAPRVHHAWSAEDPELFTDMVRTFTETGKWPKGD
ncbi:alpha/beta fold hydrolase [Corynebacterium lubricantis]|uniref:alpha/beta fold hydrolase n=1 Tax=Corynebacterium lubricantis TaxID=541095 RepID=UPI001B7F9461|nr:alpha/beta hydrolase [Corynebacterium lubricantis]